MREIIEKAQLHGYDYRGREVYRIDTQTGFVLFIPMGRYAQYQCHDRGKLCAPISWQLSEWRDFATIINLPQCRLVLESQRRYGQPKLKKPDVLKGVAQVGSAQFTTKCKCPCFIFGDDVWIKHRDFFSPEFCPEKRIADRGQSAVLTECFGLKPRPKRFVYEDNYSAIVLRAEAWLRLENLIPLMRVKPEVVLVPLIWSQLRQAVRGLEEYPSTDWTVFFESALRVVKDVQQITMEEKVNA